jgi:adenosine kinase
MNPTIAVLGPIPRDHIITHHGETIQKYGCIMHPVAALSKLYNGQATIVPVANVRKFDRPAILEQLNEFAGIDTRYVSDADDQGAVIRLRFLDQNRRVEKQLAFMNPILPLHVQGLTHCAAFVFVPIADSEVSLDTLRFLKEKSDGLIIFDAHGPTTTISRSGDRHLQFWIDRDQWLPYIDVLKMNLEESACCWFEKEYNIEDLDAEPTREHLRPLAAYCLQKGPKAVVITTDETGCLVYTMKDGALHEEFVPSVRVEHVVDTTGCGDSFAGGLAYGLLRHPGDYVRAARYANAFGAQRTQGKTFDVFLPLAQTEEMILRQYGEL